jgi:hypothetical protein
MDKRLLYLLLIGLAGAVGMAMVALAAWWLEPGQRVARRLRLGLAGAPEVLTTAPARGQGAALAIDERKLAVVRGPGDLGLVYDLDELVGAELIFDGAVVARASRGDGRRPLDQVAPSVSRVTLRFVFDDPRDPDFEFELYAPDDALRRDDPGPDAAVLVARRWFARLEAVLRRPVG